MLNVPNRNSDGLFRNAHLLKRYRTFSMGPSPVNRITDVVPANFICDTESLVKIAQSKLQEEEALSAVEGELYALKSRLQRLKEETTSVEQLIADMVARQTRLRVSITTHTSLLTSSPIRALPDEVLSEIFAHYVALSQPVTRTVFAEIVVSHRIHTPILQVCRRWRTTALADPRLWTTIPLAAARIWRRRHPLISGSPDERIAYWQALEHRIEHTSGLPLSILFVLHNDGVLGELTYATACFQTLVRLFPRARSLSIDLPAGRLDIPELRSIIDNVELAQADHILTARIHNHDEAFRKKVMSAIPNVEVLQMDALDIEHWLLNTPNAGHRLRSLQLNDLIPLSDVLALLEHLPLLDIYRLGCVAVPSSHEHLRIVTHPLLSNFRIAAVGRDDNTLPALRTFTCAAPNTYDELPWPRPSTNSFLTRSGCALTELAFLDYRLSVGELTGIFAYQKSITILRLNVIPDSKVDWRPHETIPMDILDYLTAQPEGGLEPRLPALRVLWASVLPSQLKAMKRLIYLRSGEQARTYGFAELEEVVIRVCMKHADNEVKQAKYAALFAPFVDAGVDVQISYGPADR